MSQISPLPMWVLGTTPRPSALAASTLNRSHLPGPRFPFYGVSWPQGFPSKDYIVNIMGLAGSKVSVMIV